MKPPGIDVSVSLPPNVRVKDVANVLGGLLGVPCMRNILRGGGTATRRPGVEVLGIADLPECAYILLPTKDRTRWLFHYESAGGRRSLIRDAFAVDIAVLYALADFFGGVVDHDPFDTKYVVADKGDEENHPDDGEPWERLQQRLASVKPLRPKDFARFTKLAAYNEDGSVNEAGP